MSPGPPNAPEPTWHWWPCFIGGFAGALLTHLFMDWMWPPGLALGAAFFVMWVAVGLVFLISPPGRRWSFVRWVGNGAVGSLIIGALAWIVHS